MWASVPCAQSTPGNHINKVILRLVT